MKIVFFSEIRWDYLKTRKQQIISRFPEDWQVLFLEPHKKGKKMNLAPVWQSNVCVATMPLFFKNFKPAMLKWILSFKIVRFFILLLGWIWTKEIIRRSGFQSPDLIMCSNIYAAPFVKMLAGEAVPVIYDKNDNHLGFNNTPAWARNYFNSLCIVSSRIVVPLKEMSDVLPAFARVGNVVIPNGADYSLFGRKNEVIIYVGAIADWIDIELLVLVAKSFPHKIIRLIGPVSTDITLLSWEPNIELIGVLPQNIAAGEICAAECCLVPFHINSLTRYTSANKVCEYLAAKKQVIATNYSLALEPFRDSIFIADDYNDFICKIKDAMSSPKKYKKVPDWKDLAADYVKLIKEITNSRVNR